MKSELEPWPKQFINIFSDKTRDSTLALTAGDISLTHSQLFGRVAHLVGTLKSEYGITRGMRVMTAYPDTSVGWIGFCLLQISLGCLGACFTVLDTRSKSLTKKARSHVIRVFRPDFYIPIDGIVVDHEDLPAALLLDWDTTVLGKCVSSEFALYCDVELNDGAFVDWTSGSTGGLPKGCVTTHRTLANMYMQKWSSRIGFLTDAASSTVGSNLFFLWYWWQPICHGSHSVVILDKELRDVFLLNACIDRHAISVLDCITPSLLKVLCDTKLCLHNVLHVLVSGEGLPVKTASQCLATFPACRLYNMFSTTETGDSAMVEITGNLLATVTSKMCPIGRALFGVSLIVTDEDELIVANTGACEYIGDPLATAAGFNAVGWKSKDKVVDCGDGLLVIQGRLDDCVKVRGFKIDLHAIENEISLLGATGVAVANEEQIFVFVKNCPLTETELMHALKKQLSDSHVPQRVVYWDDPTEFPLTRTGKLDRKYLASLMDLDEQSENDAIQCNTVEERVIRVFRSFPLAVVENEMEASFWERGGTSLMAMSLCAQLGIPVKILMESPVGSPSELIAYLLGGAPETGNVDSRGGQTEKVAIVGMSGRWPGIAESANSELIFRFLKNRETSEGLLDIGLVRGFDCEYWNIPQLSATKLDPHQRMFLEMAKEALIDAGYCYGVDSCGVFASGGSLSHYLEMLADSLDEIREKDPAKYLDLEIGCDKDYVALRVAKLLNLTGPAMTVQAACASSLVAVAQAAAAIRSGECSLAIAGGISLALSAGGQAGHVAGLIWSKDGKCRPFDDQATGTVNSNAGHAFVLKNYNLAIRDGDAIYGVLTGGAIVNDGSLRGKDFVAPSISGHVEAIRKALHQSGRTAEEVTMMEAHGTGTPMGDPMEYAAIVEAYRLREGPVLNIGSVKGNIGHANTAAGAIGLAKVLTSLYRKCLFPSGSFTHINRNIVANNLVHIQSEFSEWTSPMRVAGISSLGMGGTNCHLIIEAPPNIDHVAAPTTEDPLYVCSGHSIESVKSFWGQLDKFEPSGEIASTLLHFRDHKKAKFRKAGFASECTKSIAPIACMPEAKGVVIMFPGQGGAWPEIGFAMDAEIVSMLGFDPFERYTASPDIVLSQTALFAVQYTLGKALISVLPTAIDITVCGHSIGEYAAAVLAGSLDLAGALRIVQKRSELLATIGGSMAVVSASAAEVTSILHSYPSVELACYNRDNRVTISGPTEGVKLFVETSGLGSKILNTSGAFHSSLVDVVLPEFHTFIESLDLTLPASRRTVKWLSSLTGGFVSGQAGSEHWCAHTRKPVLFAQCVSLLGSDRGTLFVDTGKMLAPLLGDSRTVLTLNNDLQSVAPRLWELGFDVDLSIVKTQRVLGLPTIGWDRTDCWPQVKQRAPATLPSANNIAFAESWVPISDCPLIQDKRDIVTLTHADQIIQLVSDAFEEGFGVVVNFNETDEIGAAMLCFRLIQAFAKGRSEIDRIITVSLIICVVHCPVLLGIVRCAQSEHPDLGIVLLRHDFIEQALWPNNEYRVENSRLLVRRIEPVSTFPSFTPHVFPPQGSYILTGGLGGIGVQLVNWLIREHDARRVILLTRKHVPVQNFGWDESIVEIIPCDFVAPIETVSVTQWTCVFHLAGQVKDGLIANIATDPEEFMSVSEGKIRGASWLLEHIRPTCKIVFFSSTSGLFGSPGQALYAAANTALDELAMTGRIYSIQWGGWASSVKNSMSDRFGLTPLEDCERYLSIEQGLDAMMKVLGQEAISTIAIADIYDWRQYIAMAHLNKELTCLLEKTTLLSEEQVRMGNFKWLGDHCDESGPLVPATALIGAMLATNSALAKVVFSEPLRLGRFVQINSLGDRIVVQSSADESELVVNASASLSVAFDIPESMKSLMHKFNFKNLEWSSHDVEKLYMSLSAGGFQYGPSFKRVQQVLSRPDGLVIARIDGELIEKGDSVYYEHAAVLDACTHIASVLDPRASSSFPSSVKSVAQFPASAVRDPMQSIFKSAHSSDWFALMRMSPLHVGPEFSEKVCVDLLAVGPQETIWFEELQLTPVEQQIDSVVALEVSSEGEMTIAKKLDRPISVENQNGFSIEIVAPMQTRRKCLATEETNSLVTTKAWGLSFLDVLAAKGVMSNSLFGGEFAGIYKGDRVMGLCNGGMKSHVAPSFVVKIPETVSFLEAATLPVSYTTALFALSRAGRMKPGCVVMIHNATGALGMALIRVLTERYPQCKILATCSSGKASSELKKNACNIVDSRNPSTWTESIPDQSVHVSIGAMHPILLSSVIPLMSSFGVIVDVGKRLQVENTLLSLGPFTRGLTYTTAHLDELMRVDPPEVQTLLVEAATFAPLPYRVFRIEDIDSGLDFLASGKHVGKVVVEMPEILGPRTLNQLDWEMQRLFGTKSVNVEILRDSKFNDDTILQSLSFIHSVGPTCTALQFVSESWLLGPGAVPPAFRLVRKELLTSSEMVGDSNEQNWLENAVQKLLGKAFDRGMSLEQLGIDSLGRLQLWHTFRRQFPHSKSSQLSSTLPIHQIFGDKTVDLLTGEKWLALHGFRTNPTVIEHQLGNLIAKILPGVQCMYPEAPHTAKGPCPVDGEGFEWWSSKEATSSYEEGWIGDSGLEKSIQQLELLCASNNFAGVIGFSQGAGMAHHLVASGKIPRGILFSPVSPAGQEWPRVSGASSKLIIVLDNSDQSVQTYPTNEFAVLLHQEGHKIPELNDNMIDKIKSSVLV